MNRIKGVLVPTDFSETSDAALQHGVDMARFFGARLYFVHVPGATGENFEADFPLPEFEAAVQKRLETFISREELARLQPEYAIRVGPTSDEIVRYAEAREVDLIVMGTHGRTGMAHLLMGSVAEQVIRLASCPVMLVRAPKPVAKPRTVAAGTTAHAPVAIL